MAVVVEVADDGHADAELIQRLDDLGHRARGLFGVHGDAHQFRAGLGQRHHLVDRRRTSAVSVLVIDWTTIG